MRHTQIVNLLELARVVAAGAQIVTIDADVCADVCQIDLLSLLACSEHIPQSVNDDDLLTASLAQYRTTHLVIHRMLIIIIHTIIITITSELRSN